MGNSLIRFTFGEDLNITCHKCNKKIIKDNIIYCKKCITDYNTGLPITDNDNDIDNQFEIIN